MYKCGCIAQSIYHNFLFVWSPFTCRMGDIKGFLEAKMLHTNEYLHISWRVVLWPLPYFHISSVDISKTKAFQKTIQLHFFRPENSMTPCHGIIDDLSQVTYVTSHLCHKSLMSQSVDYMSQNNFVTNRPSTKQNCDKSSI